MIIVQDQIRSLFIFFVYNLDLLSLLHCFFIFALFFFCYVSFRLLSFFFFYLLLFFNFFYFISTKKIFFLSSLLFSSLLFTSLRISSHLFASLHFSLLLFASLGVVVGVVVGVMSLARCCWCSCGMALRASLGILVDSAT